MKRIYLLFVLAAAILSSCTSLLDFTSARTIGQGNNELTASFTSTNDENDAGQSTGFVAPAVDLTRGLSDKFDMGVNLQPFGTIGLHGKYQFIGTEEDKYAFAALPEVGFAYNIKDGKNTDNIFGALDLKEPFVKLGVIGSYYHAKELSGSSSFKTMFLPSTETFFFNHNFGIEVGKKIKFSVMAGYVLEWVDINDKSGFVLNTWQYGLGVKKPINFGANKKEEPKTIQ